MAQVDERERREEGLFQACKNQRKKKRKWTEGEEGWDGRDGRDGWDGWEYWTWLGHEEMEMVQENNDRRRIFIAFRRPLELNHRYNTLSYRQTHRHKEIITDEMGYGSWQTLVWTGISVRGTRVALWNRPSFRFLTYRQQNKTGYMLCCWHERTLEQGKTDHVGVSKLERWEEGSSGKQLIPRNIDNNYGRWPQMSCSILVWKW